MNLAIAGLILVGAGLATAAAFYLASVVSRRVGNASPALPRRWGDRLFYATAAAAVALLVGGLSVFWMRTAEDPCYRYFGNPCAPAEITAAPPL